MLAKGLVFVGITKLPKLVRCCKEQCGAAGGQRSLPHELNEHCGRGERGVNVVLLGRQVEHHLEGRVARRAGAVGGFAGDSI